MYLYNQIDYALIAIYLIIWLIIYKYVTIDSTRSDS